MRALGAEKTASSRDGVVGGILGGTCWGGGRSGERVCKMCKME